MKKYVLSLLLSMSILLASCGQKNPCGDPAPDQQTAQVSSRTDADQTAKVPGDSPAEGQTPENDNQDGISGTEKELPTGLSGGESSDTGKEDGDSWVKHSILLSDHILKQGDTLRTLYPTNEDMENHGMEVTLHAAKLYDSLADAGLDKAQMEERTENYDLQEEPIWCSVDDSRILVCDMTLQNINQDRGDDGDQHIGEFQVVYADPSTGEVCLLSCAPAYFSASSSQAGAPDYYHYRLPVGESKDVTVAWLIPMEYALEDLYLCSQNDAESAEERQYFRLAE